MLIPGTRVGPYEVTGSLGKGGMGEVHRARDKRLGRDVALKVLPDDVASDRDRMARFEREARLLASLNHPHIAAIYGIEDAGSAHALVMELAEGPTLLERMSLTPPHPASVSVVGPIQMSLDGKSYVYSYRRVLDRLYVVERLE